MQGKKDKLLDLALDGLLSKEDLSDKKIIIETEISKIQAKLKELKSKKKKPEEEKEQNKKLKESILKQLVITKDNLENYIEELLDKIIVVEKESEVELKIILAGNKIITYGSANKLRQFSQLKQNKVADYKNLPLCHSHAASRYCRGFDTNKTYGICRKNAISRRIKKARYYKYSRRCRNLKKYE